MLIVGFDGQVEEWTQVYKGITFSTIKGVGHEVPLPM